MVAGDLTEKNKCRKKASIRTCLFSLQEGNMNKTESEILWDIMNAGGVVTTEIISIGYDLKYDTAYRKLEELYQERFLNKRSYFIKPANKSVYQITQKATKLFDKKDSNLRKNHSGFAMRRYLTKADIYFTLLSRNIDIAIPNFENEKVIALKKAGFSEKRLPKRIYNAKNGDIKESLYFDDIILYIKKGELQTIAVDDYRLSQDVFMKNLVKKYEMLLSEDNIISVDLVTDSKLRAAIFKNIFDLKYKENLKKVKVNFKYLSRCYEKTD